MEPALREGDEVLARPGSNARIGDIVVARHPFDRSVQLIKRVTDRTDDGAYLLHGDNPGASTDSRTLGAFPQRSIRAVVTSRIDER